MLSLSRARFYDLVERGVFLSPVYSLANRRPLYTADMQQANLTARQTGVGCNGEFVIFYERLPNTPAAPARRRPARPDHGGLVESLKSLGLAGVTAAQVDEAVAVLFPGGTTGVDEDTVLRTIYRHLRHRGTG